MYSLWRKICRKYRFKDSEIYKFNKKGCKGYLVLLDMKRKMQWSEDNSQLVYENEQEFLEDVRENYIKVVVLSSRELEDSEYTELIDFLDILLDYPGNRDWNTVNEIINKEDVDYISAPGLSMLEYDLREYKYLKGKILEYGVSLPELEINEITMSRLSQE